jgi:DNA-directed RNA polymerase beta subunit
MQEVAREGRVQYVVELLQKDFLPHVGVDASVKTRTRKCFYLGYVVHKLMLCALDRAEEDDRDHFANKRLDLAGPLIGTLFRLLFYNVRWGVRCVLVSTLYWSIVDGICTETFWLLQVTKGMRALLQKQLDQGREPVIPAAIKHQTLTKGLRYCLATGNWGVQGSAAAPKTGVSQVSSCCRSCECGARPCIVTLLLPALTPSMVPSASHFVRRCSIASHTPLRCRTCDAPTLRSDAKGSRRSRVNSITRSGA